MDRNPSEKRSAYDIVHAVSVNVNLYLLPNLLAAWMGKSTGKVFITSLYQFRNWSVCYWFT